MKRLSIITSAYKSTNYLERYYKNMVALAGFPDFKIVVVLNDASSIDLSISEEYRRSYPENIYYESVPRESIAQSINRGYQISDTELLAYADVDDIRVPDCYLRQIHTMDSNPDVDFTYGDFVVVNEYGSQTGNLVRTSEYDFLEFTRSSMVGPNHLFRRSLLERCGYWDEQLKSGGDFDFQIRAAMNCKFKKTSGGPILYYTSAPNGSSASQSPLQPLERTVIELRYGIFDKIDLQFFPASLRYSVPLLRWDEVWHEISHFVPEYNSQMQWRRKNWFDNRFMREPSVKGFRHALKKKFESLLACRPGT